MNHSIPCHDNILNTLHHYKHHFLAAFHVRKLMKSNQFAPIQSSHSLECSIQCRQKNEKIMLHCYPEKSSL